MPYHDPQTAQEITVGVVIPCYRASRHVLPVIADTLSLQSPRVTAVYVVDDCCPEHTGDLVERSVSDNRVVVLRNTQNKGVGGAVMAGYRRGIADRMTILVKIDSDGQMDPRLLPRFVAPIANGQADYVKGNRFYDLTHIKRMPFVRIVGNAALSFMAKISTGYWTLFDPTNGYTAISAPVAALLPFEKISERYFFETDLLFRLNILRAVVTDIPMHAMYGDESSNLAITRVLPEFALKHIRNGGKRIFYNYFLRSMSIASLQLVVGTVMLLFGATFGAWHWSLSAASGRPAPTGTVMLAVLPIILGVQFLLAFLAFDFSCVPTRPLTADLLLGPPRNESDNGSA